MDRSGKLLLRKVSIDVVCLAIVGFSVLVFYEVGKPYERGFFCDDESLKHPYRDSTVSSLALYVVGFALPISAMIGGEYMAWKKSGGQSSFMVYGHVIPSWVAMAYSKIGCFGYGSGMTAVTTDVAKYMIGRLRPHFMDVCKPNVDCSLPENQHRYIEKFECTGGDDSLQIIKEVRLSFPSGHSSFSAYTMVWLVLYLQLRMTWKGSKLLRHFLQFICFLMAWFTAMSRISDYKHHWSDVLAGSSIGAVIALISAFGVADLFRDRRVQSEPEEKLRSVDYDAENGTQDEQNPLRPSPTSYGGVRRPSSAGDS